MYKRSIVVLGMILGSYAPGAAQTTGPKLARPTEPSNYKNINVSRAFGPVVCAAPGA